MQGLDNCTLFFVPLSACRTSACVSVAPRSRQHNEADLRNREIHHLCRFDAVQAAEQLHDDLEAEG